MLIGWHVLLGFTVLLATLIGVVVGQQFRIEEQKMRLMDAIRERDRNRREVEALTDAIARANRTPVVRGPPAALERSETWYEGQPVVMKITPGTR